MFQRQNYLVLLRSYSHLAAFEMGIPAPLGTARVYHQQQRRPLGAGVASQPRLYREIYIRQQWQQSIVKILFFRAVCTTYTYNEVGGNLWAFCSCVTAMSIDNVKLRQSQEKLCMQERRSCCAVPLPPGGVAPPPQSPRRARSNATTFAQSMWKKIQVFLPCGRKNESASRPAHSAPQLPKTAQHGWELLLAAVWRIESYGRPKQAEDYSQIITGWNEM